MTTSSTIVQRLWNYCSVLRDDGMSYGDYVEQLTYLLFLKMDAEQRLLGRESAIPAEYQWASLLGRDGAELERHYIMLLDALGKGSGLIPVIFRKAQNRIQNPAKLRRLIDLIDSETWIGLHIDVKGESYEGLLEKNAQRRRPALHTAPAHPGDRRGDASRAGRGPRRSGLGDGRVPPGRPRLRGEAARRPRQGPVAAPAPGGPARLGDRRQHGAPLRDEPLPARGRDQRRRVAPPRRRSLAADRFDLVLTNPPFGKKSSVTFVNETGETRREATTIVRNDFWASTNNKQLNFIQHIKTLLKMNGRAAVVVPNNVLFEGGAGETIRMKVWYDIRSTTLISAWVRRLLHECDVHTILGLPPGILYAQGVKANVIFFDRKPASATPWTQQVWIYDEVLATWRAVTGAAEQWLEQTTTEGLLRTYTTRNGAWSTSYGNLLQRVIYHYWYHIGEVMAIRQQLGHLDLPDFVGDIDEKAPFQPA